jgi:heterotetrameric sarcosine oxidase delta subunit
VLLIRCPWCGHREETEFRYGGEAHLPMPGPDADDRTWGRFLFYRRNPTDRYFERWVHVHGCRRWFQVVRDPTTHRITGSYLVTERPEDAR